jgi:hypothetical protein
MDQRRRIDVSISSRRAWVLCGLTGLVALAIAACSGSAQVATTTASTAATATRDAVVAPSPSTDPASASTQPDDPAPTPLASTASASTASVISDGQLGGETPLAAVESFIAAANATDPLGLLAMLEPTERRFVGEIYSRFLDGATNEWPQFGGESAISMLGTELLPVGPLEVEQLSPYLAFVSAREVEFWLSNPTDVVASFAWEDGPWTDASRKNDVKSIDDWSDLYDGYDDPPVGVVTVLIDGRWYVSLGRSGLEAVRRDARLPPDFAREQPAIGPAVAASPIEAVENFAVAIEAESMYKLFATLVPGEAQVVADYAPVLNDWLGFALRDLELSATLDTAVVIEEREGRAIVELEAWSWSAFGTFDDETDTYYDSFDAALRVDGACTVLDVEGDRSEACLPKSDPWSNWGALPFAAGWQGFRVVTAEIGGRWAVSVYDTAALWLDSYTQEPLYTAVFAPFWESPAPVTLLNEKAKSLPLRDPSGPVEMTLVADGRIGLARLAPVPGESLMRIVDRPGLPEYCSISIWNTDMVSSDWSEEPEYYASSDEDDGCAEMIADGLPLPTGVELTIVFVGEDGGTAPTTLTFGP